MLLLSNLQLSKWNFIFKFVYYQIGTKFLYMEIQDIKNRLNITDVANHLGIKIDRNQRALCPFHADKNPSLQFSKEKQIATCFSSNCNLGTVDIIGLTEKSKNINTHEAIIYLQENFNLSTEVKTINNTKEKEIHNYQEDFAVMQSSFLNSTIVKKYTESRNLNYKTLEIGYNAFKSSKFNYLRGCITFGLKDKQGKIVSMYGRSVRDNDKAKHYYTANRKGLYPSWPKPETTKLIITERAMPILFFDQLFEIFGSVGNQPLIYCLKFFNFIRSLLEQVY